MKSLFKDFKKTSKKDWLAKVEKDLKGKPLESLDWKINEQITISPLAHADDFLGNPTPLFDEKKTNEWEKGVWILVKNYKTANQSALALLENGATAICFEFSDNPTKKDLEILLNKIQAEWISLHFILQKRFWKRTMTNLTNIFQQKKFNLKKVKGSIQFKNKEIFRSTDFVSLQKNFEKFPAFQFATINGRVFYDGKENIVYELLQILHHANNYLEKWNDQNLNLKDLISKIQFSILLDDSYYINIAKIRAIKILWKMVVKAWNPRLKTTCEIEVHLTNQNFTKDENQNKIKATNQAMSAVIGGANRLYIYPTSKKNIQNQQRLNLNIQHLMQLESYMDRVIDPAAGSYFLEKLTDKLAEEVWKKFQNLWKKY